MVFGVLFYMMAVLFGAPMSFLDIGMAAFGALMTTFAIIGKELKRLK